MKKQNGTKNMNGIFLILGAAPYEKRHIDILQKHIESMGSDMFICCADGGAWLAKDLGTDPDILIGDLDSCDEERIRDFYDDEQSKDFDVIKLNPVKNDTDLFASIDYGLENGYKNFVLMGVTGGRLDHFMGAIAALEYAMENRAEAVIIDEMNKVRMLRGPGTVKLSDNEYRFFSIVSLDRAIEGISISGAKYNVANYTLDRFSSRCISNEIEDGAAEAVISIEKGTCLIIQSR